MTDIYKAPEAELRDKPKDQEYGSIETALAGEYELKPLEVLKQAWAMLPGLKMPVMMGWLCYILISMAFSGIGYAALGISFESTSTTPTEVVWSIIEAIALMPLFVGITMMGVKHACGRQVSLEDGFKYYSKIVPITLLTILYYLAIGLGFVALILPGIYLMVAFMMSYQLQADKKLGIVQCLETSRKAVTKKWFNMFLILLLIMLVFILGFVALLVGLIWALPLGSLMMGIVYRDMFGVEKETLS